MTLESRIRAALTPFICASPERFDAAVAAVMREVNAERGPGVVRMGIATNSADHGLDAMWRGADELGLTLTACQTEAMDRKIMHGDREPGDEEPRGLPRACPDELAIPEAAHDPSARTEWTEECSIAWGAVVDTFGAPPQPLGLIACPTCNWYGDIHAPGCAAI